MKKKLFELGKMVMEFGSYSMDATEMLRLAMNWIQNQCINTILKGNRQLLTIPHKR